jgi:hypothetical protein
MTCLTGGPTPCSAATGIPGRPATSSSPTCRARAALTKASPDTPWSTARPIAAAQPGTAHATTRPTRRPPTPPGSHRHPTQRDPEPTEAFDITAITSHPATAADTSQLAGSRSHRGSGLATASHSHADERSLPGCMVIRSPACLLAGESANTDRTGVRAQAHESSRSPTLSSANRRASGSCAACRMSGSGSRCRWIALSSRLVAGGHGYLGHVGGRQMAAVLSVWARKTWARRTPTDGSKVLDRF